MGSKQCPRALTPTHMEVASLSPQKSSARRKHAACGVIWSRPRFHLRLSTPLLTRNHNFYYWFSILILPELSHIICLGSFSNVQGNDDHKNKRQYSTDSPYRAPFIITLGRVLLLRTHIYFIVLRSLYTTVGATLIYQCSESTLVK